MMVSFSWRERGKFFFSYFFFVRREIVNRVLHGMREWVINEWRKILLLVWWWWWWEGENWRKNSNNWKCLTHKLNIKAWKSSLRPFFSSPPTTTNNTSFLLQRLWKMRPRPHFSLTLLLAKASKRERTKLPLIISFLSDGILLDLALHIAFFW